MKNVLEFFNWLITNQRAAVVFFIAMLVCGYIAISKDREIRELKEEQLQMQLAAEQAARRQEAQWLTDVDFAVAEARKWEAKYEAVVKRNRTLSMQLRNAIATANRKLPEASEPTVTEYAATTGELLAECGERYTEMAAVADGHATDVRTLITSWPRADASGKSH